MKALYNFTKADDDNLNFTKDSIIYVIKKPSEWWHVGVCNGKVGDFPANYVSVLEQGNMSESAKAPVNLPPSLQPPNKDPNAPVKYIEKGKKQFPL